MLTAHLTTAACIILCPLIWNVIARAEYNGKIISRHTGVYLGCYLLASWIFTFSLFRDFWFEAALNETPAEYAFDVNPMAMLFGKFLVVAGLTLVVTSFYQLGLTGTYLGDYFGILLPYRITAFPFSHFEHPMYDGASLAFLGRAIQKGSGSGVALAALAFIVYRIAAEYFEGPFTTMIYANAAAAAEADAPATNSAAKKSKRSSSSTR